MFFDTHLFDIYFSCTFWTNEKNKLDIFFIHNQTQETILMWWRRPKGKLWLLGSTWGSCILPGVGGGTQIAWHSCYHQVGGGNCLQGHSPKSPLHQREESPLGEAGYHQDWQANGWFDPQSDQESLVWNGNHSPPLPPTQVLPPPCSHIVGMPLTSSEYKLWGGGWAGDPQEQSVTISDISLPISTPYFPLEILILKGMWEFILSFIGHSIIQMNIYWRLATCQVVLYILQISVSHKSPKSPRGGYYYYIHLYRWDEKLSSNWRISLSSPITFIPSSR